MTVIHYTPSLLELFEKSPSLRGRIEHVTANYYPDIGSVKFGRASKRAYYDPNSGTVRLTAKCSEYVIGHELTHHLQHTVDGFPGGEISCDLFTFARGSELVPDFWEGRDASYLGNELMLSLLRERFTRATGRAMIHEVCKEALERRAAGRRNYIQWTKDTINRKVMESQNF